MGNYSFLKLAWKLLVVASPVLGALGISYKMPELDAFLAGWLPVLLAFVVAGCVGVRNIARHWAELTKTHPTGAEFRWLTWAWKITIVLLAPVLIVLVPGSGVNVPGEWTAFYAEFGANKWQFIIGLVVLVYRAGENLVKNWHLVNAGAAARVLLLAALVSAGFGCATGGEGVRRSINWDKVIAVNIQTVTLAEQALRTAIEQEPLLTRELGDERYLALLKGTYRAWIAARATLGMVLTFQGRQSEMPPLDENLDFLARSFLALTEADLKTDGEVSYAPAT